MPKLTVKRRSRADGEGTIFNREITRKDGSTYTRWEAKTPRLANGKRKTLYGKTQGEVREKLEKVKREIALGVFTDTSLTLGEYLDQWLKEKRSSVKPSTYNNYEYCVRVNIKPRLGNVKISKLKPIDLQTLVTGLGSDKSAHVANKTRQVLNTAFRQAVRWEIISRNPMDAVDCLPLEQKDLTLWSREELTRFLASAKSHRLFALFYLDIATGLRRGELLALRWSDLVGNKLHITRSYVKAGKTFVMSSPKTQRGVRTVALGADVLDMLEAHRARQEAEIAQASAWGDATLMFASEVGTLYNPDNLTRLRLILINRAREDWLAEATEAGESDVVRKLEHRELLPDIKMHDFRHLHVSILIRQGHNAKAVADRVGHARASFTMDRYTHLFDSQREELALNLGDYLSESDALN